jgi:hypothetical protein
MDYDYITFKLNSNGVEQWTRNYDYLGGSYPHGDDVPADMVVDAAGNTYVTGDSDNAFLTVKYDSAGVRQWAKRFEGDFAGSVGPANAVAVDDSGRVYVTGHSQDASAYYDFVTICYTSAGAQSWKKRYGQATIHEFKPWGIATDSSGTVAVTGHADLSGTGGDLDVLTVAYDTSNGTQKWARTWSGTGDGGVFADSGYAVAFGPDGSIHVAGKATMSGNGSDFLTIKYSPTGTKLWARTYNEMDSAGGSTYDEAVDIGVDSAARVFVTGGLWMDNQGLWRESNYALVVYGSDGDRRRVDTFDPVPSLPTDDLAFALALTVGGDAAVTGAAVGTTTFDDVGTWFVGSDLIFADGFETGDTSRWSSAAP